MSSMNVKDSVLLVTGASRAAGIGRSLVNEALRRGAKKVYATARKAADLNDLVAQDPDRIVPLVLDVTQATHIQNVLHQAADTQILINNAGSASQTGGLCAYSEPTARHEMDVNYFGPLHLMNAFAPHLLKNGHGAIVNILSISALYPSPGHVTYGAAKAALYSATLAARIEARIQGWTLPIFGVYPGPIDTDMARGLNVPKGSTTELATRVFDGMKQGTLDITTDALSDLFRTHLDKDPTPILAVKEAFFPSK